MAELVAITDPSGLRDERMVARRTLIEALAEIDVEWSPTTTTVPCDPPRSVACRGSEIDLEEGDGSATCRAAWAGYRARASVDFGWPCSESRPMDFVLQIVAKPGR
ncbi:MAG: hypothetical protein H6720_01630 [Sandaracinus sp.]|nr:hypothetical protein [Sandaracinus sp.]